MENKELILSVKDLRQHFPIDGGGLLKKTVGYVRAVDGMSCISPMAPIHETACASKPDS